MAREPRSQEHMLRGFHSVSAALEGYERTARLLTDSFGYRLIEESGNRFRFASPDDSAPAESLTCFVCRTPGWGVLPRVRCITLPFARGTKPNSYNGGNIWLILAMT